MTTAKIVEHKTTSEDASPGSDYWKRLQIDPQVSTYFAGGRALGHDIVECIYDVIGKPALRPSAVALTDADGVKIVHDANGQRVRTKDGKKWRESADSAQGYVLQTRPETPDEYRERLAAHVAENPERYYSRGKVVRLETEEADAAHDAWHTARLIREAELAKRWTRNPDSCVRYGRTCEFFGVCTGTETLEESARFQRVASPHQELSQANDGVRRLPLITNSQMRTFRRCAREHYYSYILGYRPVEQADTLRFGSLVHLGLEHWWRSTGDRLADALAAIAGAESDPYERARAEVLMVGYEARWGDDAARYQVLAVEAEFRAPLVNPETGAASRTYELGGKLDALVHEITEAA